MINWGHLEIFLLNLNLLFSNVGARSVNCNQCTCICWNSFLMTSNDITFNLLPIPLDYKINIITSSIFNFFSIKIIIMYFCSTLYTCEKIQFSNYHSLRTTFAFRFSYWNVVLQVWYPCTVFSSTKLKRAFLITLCLSSVYLSVSPSLSVYFSHFNIFAKKTICQFQPKLGTEHA